MRSPDLLEEMSQAIAPAGQGDEGKHDVLTKLSQLEKEIGDGPAGRKRKPEGKEPATAETPKGEDSNKEKKKKTGRVLTRKIHQERSAGRMVWQRGYSAGYVREFGDHQSL